MKRFLVMALFFPELCHAKDFSVMGQVFPVIEEDPRDVIMRKLKEKPNFAQDLRDKALDHLTHPERIPGWTPTKIGKKWQHKISKTLRVDLTDHKGNILAKRGQLMTPITGLSGERVLRFIDGTDEDQIKWGMDHKNVKIVLVDGKPFELGKEYDATFYFDQGGRLLHEFKITQIPAEVIIADGEVWVEELKLEKSKP